MGESPTAPARASLHGRPAIPAHPSRAYSPAVLHCAGAFMHHAAKQAREIADRKRAGEALAFFENNPLPGWVVDSKSHKFLAVNEAAVRHYGYSRAEFLSLTLGGIESLSDAGADAGPGRLPRRRHLRKNGTMIDVDIVSHPVPGPPACEIVLVYDVTESAERLDLALEASRTGVWSLDAVSRALV